MYGETRVIAARMAVEIMGTVRKLLGSWVIMVPVVGSKPFSLIPPDMPQAPSFYRSSVELSSDNIQRWLRTLLVGDTLTLALRDGIGSSRGDMGVRALGRVCLASHAPAQALPRNVDTWEASRQQLCLLHSPGHR